MATNKLLKKQAHKHENSGENIAVKKNGRKKKRREIGISSKFGLHALASTPGIVHEKNIYDDKCPPRRHRSSKQP